MEAETALYEAEKEMRKKWQQWVGPNCSRNSSGVINDAYRGKVLTGRVELEEQAKLGRKVHSPDDRGQRYEVNFL